MKIGLVLEGGAMRGLFTAGVLDAFLEEKLVFDGIVGVSAGAAFGCNYRSAQIGRALRYNTRFCRDKRYCSLYSLITTGDLYGAKFCYKDLPETLDPFDWKTWEENATPFWVTCTSVETGKAEHFLCNEDNARTMKLFQASASMPLVSRKVLLDGKPYLDGGISDSIPLEFMEHQGFEKNIVILTQPQDYRKEKSSALPLVALRYGKKSPLYRCMANRHEMYNSQRNLVFQREKEGSVLPLAPDAPLPVGRTEKDPEKLRLAHKIGYDTAKKQMCEIKAFLEKESR